MNRITMKRWTGGWYSRAFLMDLPENSESNGPFVVRVAKDDEQPYLTIEVVDQDRAELDEYGEEIIPEDILQEFGTRTFEEPNIFKAQVIAISDSEGYLDRFAVESHIRAVINEWERTHAHEPEFCPSVRWTEEERRASRDGVMSSDLGSCDE